MRTLILPALLALAFTAGRADAQIVIGNGYAQPYYGSYQPYGYQSYYGGSRVINGGYGNYSTFGNQSYYRGGYNNFGSYYGGNAYRSYGGNYGGYRGMSYGRRR